MFVNLLILSDVMLVLRIQVYVHNASMDLKLTLLPRNVSVSQQINIVKLAILKLLYAQNVNNTIIFKEEVVIANL